MRLDRVPNCFWPSLRDLCLEGCPCLFLRPAPSRARWDFQKSLREFARFRLQDVAFRATGHILGLRDAGSKPWLHCARRVATHTWVHATLTLCSGRVSLLECEAPGPRICMYMGVSKLGGPILSYLCEGSYASGPHVRCPRVWTLPYMICTSLLISACVSHRSRIFKDWRSLQPMPAGYFCRGCSAGLMV